MNALSRLGRHLEAAALRLARDAERPTTHRPWCRAVLFEGRAPCSCGWQARPGIEHRGADQ